MVANKEAKSFDEIIQTARQRRRQQNLTDKFFGKNRGSSAPGSKTSSRPQSPAAGSLASRVEKRSDSSGIRKPGNAATVGSSRPKNTRRTRESRMLSSQLPEPTRPTIRESRSDFNIKGRAAAPCVVIGSNFAPGTTAADIESALEPVGGTMVNCHILSTRPAVVAEMTFAEQQGAENVVATFNNQTADGRILQLRIKQAPLGDAPAGSAKTASSSLSAFDMMRELADRERREHRRAEPQLQDGRYGFDEGEKSRNGGSGLYSDRMVVDEPTTGSQRGSRRYR